MTRCLASFFSLVFLRVCHMQSLHRLCASPFSVRELSFRDLPRVVPLPLLPPGFYPPGTYLQPFWDKAAVEGGGPHVPSHMPELLAAGQPIPLLEEVFKAFPEATINIDCKTPDAELVDKVAVLVRQYERADRTILGSFSADTCARLRLASPTAGHIFSGSEALWLYVAYFVGALPFMPLHADYLEVPLLTPARLEAMSATSTRVSAASGSSVKGWLIRQALACLGWIATRPWLYWHLQQRGVRVIFWVVNDEDEFKVAFDDLHADGVMTDYPTRLSDFLARWSAKEANVSSVQDERMASEKNKGPMRLLVIDGYTDFDWSALFADAKLHDGTTIVVESCGWGDLSVSASSHGRTRAIVSIKPSSRMREQGVRQSKIFNPDFLLVRNECRGVDTDYRNALFGLMYANVPSVNTLQSIYMFLERPVVQAELNALNRKYGEESFPLIPQNYFASFRDMFYGLSFPAVAKLGHAHAGYGKMKIPNHHDMEDFRTVVAMSSHYVTCEPFLIGEYDLRIQKIGTHYRVFRRFTMSGSWKTNMGSSHLEEIELTPQYKLWVDEASKFFGGLDILTVDAIHTADGLEFILEVNGTSSGLSPDTRDEDSQHILEITLQRMNEHFCSAVASITPACVEAPIPPSDSQSAVACAPASSEPVGFFQSFFQ